MNLLNGIFMSPFSEWLRLTTGVVNLVTALLLLFTCRFVPRLGLTSEWMNHGWYLFWYKYHSYVWWLFAPSLILHAVFTIVHILLGG